MAPFQEAALPNHIWLILETCGVNVVRRFFKATRSTDLREEIEKHFVSLFREH